MQKLKRVDFFPIAAALVPVVVEVVRKIFGKGKKCANKRLHRPSRKVILVSKQCRIKVKKMAVRDRTIMMKRDTPKRVTLPNCRTFVVRYERVTRNDLQKNVRLRQPFKQRAASCRKCHHQIAVQQGFGIGSIILKFAKKVAKTPILQELGNMALNELPNLYNKDTCKIKIKKIKAL